MVNLRVPTAQGKQNENRENRKNKEEKKMSGKTLGILGAQVLNFLILNIKGITKLVAKFSICLRELILSSKPLLHVKHLESTDIGTGKTSSQTGKNTRKTQGILKYDLGWDTVIWVNTGSHTFQELCSYLLSWQRFHPMFLGNQFHRLANKQGWLVAIWLNGSQRFV